MDGPTDVPDWVLASSMHIIEVETERCDFIIISLTWNEEVRIAYIKFPGNEAEPECYLPIN